MPRADLRLLELFGSAVPQLELGLGGLAAAASGCVEAQADAGDCVFGSFSTESPKPQASATAAGLVGV